MPDPIIHYVSKHNIPVTRPNGSDLDKIDHVMSKALGEEIITGIETDSSTRKHSYGKNYENCSYNYYETTVTCEDGDVYVFSFQDQGNYPKSLNVDSHYSVIKFKPDRNKCVTGRFYKLTDSASHNKLFKSFSDGEVENFHHARCTFGGPSGHVVNSLENITVERLEKKRQWIERTLDNFPCDYSKCQEEPSQKNSGWLEQMNKQLFNLPDQGPIQFGKQPAKKTKPQA